MAKLTQAMYAALMVALVAGLTACDESEKVEAKKPVKAATPPATNFTVGGSVTGLPSSGLVLQLNGANDLEVGSNGRFNFPNKLTKGTNYAVTVKTNPSSPVKQTCTVADGIGAIASAAVSNIAVNCVTNSYAVGGKVSGLSGKGLSLQLNDTHDVMIEKNGNFLFPGVRLPDGSDYRVAIKAIPARQTCTIEPINTAPNNDTINIVSVSCKKKGRR